MSNYQDEPVRRSAAQAPRAVQPPGAGHRRRQTPAMAGKQSRADRLRHSATLAETAPDERPQQVPGPFDEPLTLDSLPPANTRRWVVRRKAEVLAAINGGLLTAAEACARYGISPEELELWQKSLDRAGIAGLRVTRIQLYRANPPRPDAHAVAPAHPSRKSQHLDLSRAWDI